MLLEKAYCAIIVSHVAEVKAIGGSLQCYCCWSRCKNWYCWTYGMTNVCFFNEIWEITCVLFKR